MKDTQNENASGSPKYWLSLDQWRNDPEFKKMAEEEFQTSPMAEGQEDVANAPEAETQTADYMTKTIAGGLNKQKRDIAGNGQTTVPVTAVRVQEAEELESHLTKLYQQYKA